MTTSFDDFFTIWADQGEFPELDQLDFTVSQDHPILGTFIKLKWSGTGALSNVDIYKDDQPLLLEQPRSGSYRLAIETPDTFELIATFGTTSKRITVSPKVEQPIISRFSVDRHTVELNNKLNLKWRTRHAETVWLVRPDGTREPVNVSGDMLIDGPSSPAVTHYQLIATNMIDIQTDQAVEIKWIYPKVFSCLSTSSKVVGLGEAIEITWKVENAREYWLEASQDKESITVPLQAKEGTLIHHPNSSTTYVLVAVDMNGKRSEQKVSVTTREYPLWGAMDERLKDLSLEVRKAFLVLKQ